VPAIFSRYTKYLGAVVQYLCEGCAILYPTPDSAVTDHKCLFMTIMSMNEEISVTQICTLKNRCMIYNVLFLLQCEDISSSSNRLLAS